MLQSISHLSHTLNPSSSLSAQANFNLKESVGLDQSSQISGAERISPSLFASTGNGTAVPDFSDIRLPDHDGRMLPYAIDASLVLPTNIAAQSVANNITRSMAENPDLRFAIIGEVHSVVAEQFFQETASALNNSGVNLVVGIETPTTPEVDKLIDLFFTGEISEGEFLENASQALHESYLSAVFRRDDPLANPDGLLAREYWVERLRNDVVSYVDQGINVAFIDPGRFVEGADREVEMANALLAAQSRNPDSLILAQIGALHAQPGYVPVSADRKNGEAIWNEALNSRMSGLEPANMRLQDLVGPQAIQTYIGAEYRENRAGEPIYTVIDPFSMREADYDAIFERYAEQGEDWDYGLPSELPGMGGGGYFIYHDSERYPEPKSRTME